MAKKVARFSNGFTDEYKGARDVKAAWMITDKDGNVKASGHSLSRAAAQKTAEAHGGMRKHGNLYVPSAAAPPQYHAYYEKEARRLGYHDGRAMVKAQKEENAAHRATMKIEIVDL